MMNRSRFQEMPQEIEEGHSAALFADTHEPIIDRAAWEKIQEKQGKI